MDYELKDYITYAEIKSEHGMSRDAVIGRSKKTGVQTYSMRQFVQRGNAPHAILRKDLDTLLNFKENLIEDGVQLVYLTKQMGKVRQTVMRWIEDLEIKTYQGVGGSIHVSRKDAARLLSYVPEKKDYSTFSPCQVLDTKNIKQGLYHKVMPYWTMTTHQGSYSKNA
jgi:hypothetical protein